MKFSACGSWFDPDDFETKIVNAAREGFEGIEILGWNRTDTKRAGQILTDNNITLSAILIQSKKPENMPILSNTHGMVYEDARPVFLEAMKETVEAANNMHVPNIVVTTGNERHDISREAQHAIIVETLKQLAPIAEAANVTIVLEPLNVLVNHPGYYLTSSAEAFEIIREVNSDCVKVLFDIYHQQITEGNLIENILKNIDLIGHFHMADVPGRKEPGTGEINYWNILCAISETEYDGWLAFECGKSVPLDELIEDMFQLIIPFSDGYEGCGCDCDDDCDCDGHDHHHCDCGHCH